MGDLIVIDDAPEERVQVHEIAASDFAAIFLTPEDVDELGRLQNLQQELAKNPSPRRNCEIMTEMGQVYATKGVEFVSRTMVILRYIIKTKLWRSMLVLDSEGHWVCEFQNQEAFMEHFLGGLRTIRDAYMYMAKADLLEKLGFNVMEISGLLADPSKLGDAMKPILFESMPEGARFAGFITNEIQERVREELSIPTDEDVAPEELAREYIEYVAGSTEAASHITKRVMDEWTHKQYYHDDGAGGGPRVVFRGWCGDQRYSHTIPIPRDMSLHPEFKQWLEDHRGVGTMEVIRGSRKR